MYANAITAVKFYADAACFSVQNANHGPYIANGDHSGSLISADRSISWAHVRIYARNRSQRKTDAPAGFPQLDRSLRLDRSIEIYKMYVVISLVENISFMNLKIDYLTYGMHTRGKTAMNTEINDWILLHMPRKPRFKNLYM